MICENGKIGYPTYEKALEALIDHRARFNHKDRSGPINVYQCNLCEDWHFTSKGPVNKSLDDPETIKKINRLSSSYHWEYKSR